MGCCISSEKAIDEALIETANETRSRKRHRNYRIQESSDEDPLNKYEIVRELGVGSMGAIDVVKRRSPGEEETLYAMKSLNFKRLSVAAINQLKNEITIACDLDHPHIVKFFEIYFLPRQICVVMEYCSGGNLYSRRPYTDELEVAAIIRQVLKAIAYMHRRGYVHRDIKFANIMFESEQTTFLKLIDFGTSCKYDHDRPLEAQIGTLPFTAPEVFAGKYNSKIDLWSVGVVVFQMLCGQRPFDSSSALTLMTKISNGKYSFDAKGWQNRSSASKRFCEGLLMKDADARFTAEQALQHRWLSHNSPSPAVIDTGDEKETFRMYAKGPVIRKIVSLMIAHRSFPSEVEDLRKRFLEYDKNNDGYITLDEFREAFQDPEIADIFAGLDVLYDNVISYTEFLAAALTARGYYTEERIAAAFDRIDVDHSGHISLENLRDVMGERYTAEFIEGMFKEADLDRNGVITFPEFLKAFRKNNDQLCGHDCWCHSRLSAARPASASPSD